MPPDLTDQQRARARERALVARRTRADIKRRLALGEITVPEVLDLSRTDTELGRDTAKLRIGEVLLALPGMGEAKTDALLVAAGIRGDRRIRGLGPNQREQLLSGLGA